MAGFAEQSAQQHIAAMAQQEMILKQQQQFHQQQLAIAKATQESTAAFQAGFLDFLKTKFS
jgi:hypothetical protein